MLIVADPVFDVSDPRAKGASKNSGGPSGPGGKLRELALKSAAEEVKDAQPSGRPAANWGIARLDATRTEAGQIARLAGGSRGRVDVWLDLEASESNVKKRDLAAYGFLHFATHGFLSAERPQLSGLVLSLVGEDDGDGFLRVPEVFNLRLGAPLVILSACETGLGQVRHGEGVIGLTRAFMYAGAPTVGVSLWSVNDDSTAELMTDFYAGLLQGRGPAGAALRAAQLKMIAAGQYDAPYFWAPFVLVGDWR
jgi:CHAT domain-containing protein